MQTQLEELMVQRHTTPADAESSVKTIERAARVLRAVAAYPDGAMLSAVAVDTGLGKGTVHRLLNALIEAGLLFQEVESRLYRLGVTLALLGSAAHQQSLASLATPFLQQLAAKTEDTAYASVREGAAAICVAREIGAYPIRTLSLEVGHLRPLGVGSGSLALLAFLPDDEIELCIQKNATWLARYPGHSRSELMAKIGETRKCGYSLVEGQIVPGMNAIGVPVIDRRGKPVAALGLAAITERLSGPRLKHSIDALMRQARALGKALMVDDASVGKLQQ